MGGSARDRRPRDVAPFALGQTIERVAADVRTYQRRYFVALVGEHAPHLVHVCFEGKQRGRFVAAAPVRGPASGFADESFDRISEGTNLVRWTSYACRGTRQHLGNARNRARYGNRPERHRLVGLAVDVGHAPLVVADDRDVVAGLVAATLHLAEAAVLEVGADQLVVGERVEPVGEVVVGRELLGLLGDRGAWRGDGAVDDGGSVAGNPEQKVKLPS